jgi:MFS family permease
MKTPETHPDPRAARRISLTLFAGQGLGSAGFLVASTINPILGARLGGGDAWAGVPSAMYQIGVAVAAFFWGRAMDALGRRPTLMLGMASGTVGALLAGTAAARHHFAAFLSGVLLMGVANAALQLGRFVSAEVHLPAHRGRAISQVVLGGTVGAVFGPLLAGPAGTLAAALGLDPLAGPFGVSAALFVLVATLFAWLLHPEPRELARRLSEHTQGSQAAAASAPRPLRQILSDPRAALAVLTMVVGQVVMVMLMVITAVHMAHHDHGLSSISAVLSLHVFGMFAFSVLSGRLTDKLGRLPVIASGALLLLLACVTAPLSTAAWPLAGSLLVLGVGWNFCYVAGSSLLSDRLTLSERARTQGVNDFLIGSVSALGALTSGLVFARAGYAWMAGLGGVLAVLLLLACLGVMRGADWFPGVQVALVLALLSIGGHADGAPPDLQPHRALRAHDRGHEASRARHRHPGHRDLRPRWDARVSHHRRDRERRRRAPRRRAPGGGWVGRSDLTALTGRRPSHPWDGFETQREVDVQWASDPQPDRPRGLPHHLDLCPASSLLIFDGVHLHPTFSYFRGRHGISFVLVRSRDVGVSYSMRF